MHDFCARKEIAMKKCPACGFSLPEVAKYCYSCGSRLSKDKSSSARGSNVKTQGCRKNDSARKVSSSKETSCTSTSPKKRWKFVALGILFGFFGAHLAYAKRWFLFLLLWAGFIFGNVMSDNARDAATEEQIQEAQITEEASDKKDESSNSIGNAGIALWALLWIGGTLFIKKDGEGCRM